MTKIFTRERFGNPQFVALLFLLAFAAQCIWLVRHEPIQQAESARVAAGLRQWQQGMIATQDPERSPLSSLIASAGVLAYRGPRDPGALDGRRWLIRAPSILLGTLLGASLWYVARRLYGNLGGYIALALYCFSPAMIATSASFFMPPESAAMWGVFGSVFTSIAVAHTLYAPRRVLWNWWRISLLALSLALAVGSDYSLWIALPLGLAFLLYLAPGRRAAALAVYSASCALALLVLLGSYWFQLGAMVEALRQARFLHVTPAALSMSGSYLGLLARLTRTSPALLLLLPLAWITVAAWERARYFGNMAPCLVSLLMVALGLMSPHDSALVYEIAAMPIVFVFIAGVLADLLETRHRQLVLGAVVGILVAHAMWSLGSRGGLLAAVSESHRSGAFRP
jgi:hypothetical protein